MPYVVYLRGEPGAGKRTVAGRLAADLGCPTVWLHDFESVYKAVGFDPDPRLMDAVLQPVAEYLMGKGRDFLFVRPARGVGSVRRVAEAAGRYGHRFIPVRLAATYETLLRRVRSRPPSPFRIADQPALDKYLAARPLEPYPGEYVIQTDGLTPEEVAGRVKELLPK